MFRSSWCAQVWQKRRWKWKVICLDHCHCWKRYDIINDAYFFRTHSVCLWPRFARAKNYNIIEHACRRSTETEGLTGTSNFLPQQIASPLVGAVPIFNSQVDVTTSPAFAIEPILSFVHNSINVQITIELADQSHQDTQIGNSLIFIDTCMDHGWLAYERVAISKH